MLKFDFLMSCKVNSVENPRICRIAHLGEVFVKTNGSNGVKEKIPEIQNSHEMVFTFLKPLVLMKNHRIVIITQFGGWYPKGAPNGIPGVPNEFKMIQGGPELPLK